MATYKITNRTSAHTLGIYEGETAEQAIEAMDRDAGCESSEHAAEVLGTTVEALRADLLVEEIEVPTARQLRALRDEAAAAGDLDMVAKCDRALDDHHPDLIACAEAIKSAAAMAD